MYHPMLTFAVAQTRIDDLTRDLTRDRTRDTSRRLSAVEAYELDATTHRDSLSRRLARYAARRTRPSAA